MEKAPAGGDETPSENLKCKTWALRVSIHCEGCKKKVKKVLQNIEDVYKIEIDSKQQRVLVTGNVDSEALIKKLVKSGKHAEIWPLDHPNKEGKKPGESTKSKRKKDSEDSKESKDGESGNDQKKPANQDEVSHTKDSGGPVKEDDCAPVALEIEENGASRPEVTVPAGGAGGKKKKKKGKKEENTSINREDDEKGGGVVTTPATDASTPPTEIPERPIDRMNPSPSCQQNFSFPQYHSAAPEDGMSYNYAPSGATMYTSYYATPFLTQSYMYSNPSYYASTPPSDLMVDVDGRDDHDNDEFGCSIM